MELAYERDGIRLYVGDCREVVPTLPEPVSAVCTDPPYGLSFMGKDWDHEVPGEAFWRVFSDAMLPGAHLLSFGGTRTYHRIAVAIEDAGFEIRDTLMWLYGSGFPKSHDVSKAIDKMAGAGREVVGDYEHPDGKPRHWTKHTTKRSGIYSDIKTDDSANSRAITAPATDAAREWQGWGTALKPAYEPIILARKPLAGTVAQNVLTHGTGALNIDASRVATTPDAYQQPAGRWPPNVILDPAAAAELDQMSGPTSTTGNRRIKDRVQQELGATPFTRGRNAPEYTDAGGPSRYFPVLPIDDPLTRFLYQPKASRAERNAGLDGMPKKMTGMSNAAKAQGENYANAQTIGLNRVTPKANHHPTVKPLALMRWLLTLVTPPGGIVLDPFVGSGSTLVACAQLGIPAYGIDMNEEYIEIAARRIDHALNERAREEEKPRQLSIAD